MKDGREKRKKKKGNPFRLMYRRRSRVSCCYVGGDHSNPAVAAAAFAAIGAFPLEATKLKMLPAAARTGLKLPPKYCATPAEAARRPEDVLPYVPAECWPRLLLTAGKKKTLFSFFF